MFCPLTKCLSKWSPYTAFWIYFVFCNIVLGIVLFIEYGLGVEPCAFCIYERWPYVIVGLVALTAIAHHNPIHLSKYLGVIATMFLLNAGISAYHVAIEYHWVPTPSVCGGGRFAIELSFEEVKEVLLNRRIVPCDQVPFKLFGLSMPAYNGLLSFILTLNALWLMCFYRRTWHK